MDKTDLGLNQHQETESVCNKAMQTSAISHHLKTEIENTIIMEGAHIDCCRRIVDSLIGRKVKILGYEKTSLKAIGSS